MKLEFEFKKGVSTIVDFSSNTVTYSNKTYTFENDNMLLSLLNCAKDVVNLDCHQNVIDILIKELKIKSSKIAYGLGGQILLYPNCEISFEMSKVNINNNDDGVFSCQFVDDINSELSHFNAGLVYETEYDENWHVYNNYFSIYSNGEEIGKVYLYN